jgi:four helix bundle protein
MQTKDNQKDKKLFEFERLVVYKRAVDFADEMFNQTNDHSNFNHKNIISQVTRSALSISLNLAEGFSSPYKDNKKRYFRIARGSTFECVPSLRMSLRQKILTRDKFDEMYKECYEISRMISGLIKSVDKTEK